MKKPKGGRFTPKQVLSDPDLSAAAPTDPADFWAWYRNLQRRPVRIGRSRSVSSR